MSAALMDLAWKKDLKPTPKLVLLFLAECADESASCWPTIETIRSHIGVTAASIYVALNILEKAGLIGRESRAPAPNLYRLYLTESL